MITTLMVALAFSADPTQPGRYQGGARPTPLNAPGPVDERPSVIACSVDTLRTSVQCLFDARPLAAADSPAARTRQASDNKAAAQLLGDKLCRARVETLDLTDQERLARLQGCLSRVKAALPVCTLEGKEALLDADSQFGAQGQACYVALAEAAQRVSVAAADPAPSDPPRRQFPVMARPSKR